MFTLPADDASVLVGMCAVCSVTLSEGAVVSESVYHKKQSIINTSATGGVMKGSCRFYSLNRILSLKMIRFLNGVLLPW